MHIFPPRKKRSACANRKRSSCGVCARNRRIAGRMVRPRVLLVRVVPVVEVVKNGIRPVD